MTSVDATNHQVDKHGQLGIWDARAPADEVADEDGDVTPAEKGGGKYWRLQLHWPASPKSSVSCIKFDPTDSHNVCSLALDRRASDAMISLALHELL